ncbi:MAG: iron-sulfur cluster repair protein YtfE [Rhodoferax sp.]|nr:iron-sulfur cluster repair protein YtfE [Rhodoferax sp.]MCF8211149.1 iron-sulfur cluster repair protein YtfE [Rhodoferax sp.]
MNVRLATTQSAPLDLHEEVSIGQIAVQLPGATAVFRRLKLDFCCGGQVSLRQAAQDKGLNVRDILMELSALQRPSQPPTLSDPSVLIDHILSRYHEVHRVQLPELVRMARRVEAVHREHPAVPKGLADLLESIEQELLSHMQKEEGILFPMLKAGTNPFVNQPIAMMRSEHINHGLALDRLMELTNNTIPPEGACNTWRALFSGIAQLNEDLISHIHLENNILFSHFEANVQAQGCGTSACSASA